MQHHVAADIERKEPTYSCLLFRPGLTGMVHAHGQQAGTRCLSVDAHSPTFRLDHMVRSGHRVPTDTYGAFKLRLLYATQSAAITTLHSTLRPKSQLFPNLNPLSLSTVWSRHGYHLPQPQPQTTNHNQRR